MAEDVTKTIRAAEAALRQLDTVANAKQVSSVIEALNRTVMPASAVIEALSRTTMPAAVAIEALNSARIPKATLDAITSVKELSQQIANFVHQSDDLLGTRLRATDFVFAQMPDLSFMRSAVGEFNARFDLPDMSAIHRLTEQIRERSFGLNIPRFNQSMPDLEAAMSAMRAPWLDTLNALTSVQGFAELQGIGHAVQHLPAFSEGLADQLRASLGDWRDTIAWPENIFNDALARTSFYSDMGLNSRLTDFPTDAFQQGLEIADLMIPPRTLGRTQDGSSGLDDQEEGFERNNAAHDLLQRFETQIREFIDTQMTAAFGAKWIKHRVPGNMHDQWRQKTEAAIKNGEQGRPLIAYADFADYVTLIIRRDNWDAIFKPVFHRTEFIRESFQRLYPIRICTMHARIITPDDELYLRVELKRVLKAMGFAM
jgi:hypothetical protein